MVLGGVRLLEGRKTQTNLLALSMMNAMTMCVHQYEQYVEPGSFPGMVNVGIFKSDQPLNYQFNARGSAGFCSPLGGRGVARSQRTVLTGRPALGGGARGP